MKKSEIKKNHMLTREELHDLMMSYNSIEEKKVDEEQLSQLIYEYVDSISNEDIEDGKSKLDLSKYSLNLNIYYQN